MGEVLFDRLNLRPVLGFVGHPLRPPFHQRAITVVKVGKPVTSQT